MKLEISREILFKAKLKNWKISTELDAWVYGYYLSREETTYCCAEDYERSPVKTLHFIATEFSTDWGLPNEFRLYEIDPDTLCEYTGIHDNNNNKIFENDIVKTQEFSDRPDSKYKKTKRFNGVVEYRIGSGNGFFNDETKKSDMHREYSAKWRVNIGDCGKYRYSSWGDFFDCEVIGNIFDNPELIGGGLNE